MRYSIILTLWGAADESQFSLPKTDADSYSQLFILLCDANRCP